VVSLDGGGGVLEICQFIVVAKEKYRSRVYVGVLRVAIEGKGTVFNILEPRYTVAPTRGRRV
jgi:hypothetical protein